MQFLLKEQNRWIVKLQPGLIINTITLKFLVGISPSGFITFLSSCCGGRASDKFISKDSGFYDLLQHDEEGHSCLCCTL